MASRRARTAVSQTAQPNVSLAEALTKLGMTQEQFQAKQAELQAVLLQTQPFVPQNSSTRHLPTYERFTFAEDERSRSRSSSVSSSCSSRANSPAVPRTPIKADAIPPRPRDQMELILEERNRRKELQRRASTSRPNDEERVFSTPNRGADRSKTPNLPPDTPHHYKYYSERVVGVASSSKHTLDADDAPETPSRGRDRGRFKALPRYPKTPSRKQTIGSSCPATPRSSPPPEVNLVSSPGPMRPGPLENDNLPFALPEGPYSTAKPDLSYAAIIGRAIMASPNHALALQDIYEYITTVFPYYKRGEQTWMNSVRHALSTMAVFRKVQRGRAEGKSLWAVLDCDVPCFEGGGFKKTLCADMNNGMSYRSRKRAVEEAYGSRAKRKKTGNEPDSSIMMPAPILPPFFPHFASANSHTQSYYQAALQQQQVPADTLFPPLPPSSNYHRVVARTASIPILDPL
ncbi:hypothetical protein C8Q80DRAFT_166813 [Daedaleopsis nitida]|nr:hypothetical protein C8Q80DRAFT_166813 [Daedaleopsis nitida]